MSASERCILFLKYSEEYIFLRISEVKNIRISEKI
ncbi:hypothetical protein DFR97_001382 [Clostridium beijerinckii]|nr:hypothetical protein [Clostridium beijerinckii]NRZ85607.1 hypothetical protein [Clostridium beijerinckii]NSA03094.1 hypothetical protein [Clostridium beijerinckii]